MKLRVKVSGLKTVQKKFFALGKQGKEAFKGAIYKEGLHVIALAVKSAPAVTGYLRNSAYVSWPSSSGIVNIGFKAIYAASVEYGLRLINAKRSQQKAAFASMADSGWRKSAVGGPGFFRNAISSTAGGRIQRVATFAKRLFDAKQGFQPDPNRKSS